jgi:ornithine cyclodeaminase/alanine dehydrogenase-like protein (mu-crystallin family)
MSLRRPGSFAKGEAVTLFIDNEVVSRVLTMADTIWALEESYRQLVASEAVCRPRIDIQIPTSDPGKVYQWGTMEGGSQSGYFAVRMKSDVIYEQEYNGAVTQEKFCTRPGLFCGLIFLTSTETGEPLAFINDGVLQHMRVGADGGIGVKYMAREDASVVGMLGSGGMARTHMEAFTCVRDIRRLQVYSPTPANREAFAEEMARKYGIEAVACDDPREVYRDADIVAGLTDSAVPVLNGEWIEPGAHVVNVGGGGGRPDPGTLERVDVYLRFGSAPAPWGLPEMALEDEYITYAAQPRFNANFRMKRSGRRGHGAALPDRMITFRDIVEGTNRGRTSARQITYSERGNLQGAQFWAVGGLVYEKARAAGLGHEIPTEWLLQDIRD